jgi:hypothetical protein
MAQEDLTIGLLEPTDPEFNNVTIEINIKRGTVVLLVFAPKDIEHKRFRFRLEETVGAAAKSAAEAFGYHAGNPSFQTKDGAVLDRDLTLEAADLRSLEHLELVDAGGGV